MNVREVSRGEVWLIRLDPTEGNEIRKTRPCAIISPDEMNTHLGTVIVLPLTSGNRPAAFRIPTEFKSIPGLLLADQIRCVSKLRLIKRVGELDCDTMQNALGVLQMMFDE